MNKTTEYTSSNSPILNAHTKSIEEVASALDSHLSHGISSSEANARLVTYGANELAAADVIPAWRKLLAQFQDLLILILMGAAVLSFVISGELKTPLVVLVVVVFNAVLGFMQ